MAASFPAAAMLTKPPTKLVAAPARPTRSACKAFGGCARFSCSSQADHLKDLARKCADASKIAGMALATSALLLAEPGSAAAGKGSAPSNQLIDQICPKSDNYSICIQALGSSPGATAAKESLDGALRLAIEEAKFIRSQMNYIKDHLPTTAAKEKAALNDCIGTNGYAYTVASYTSAKKELPYDPQTASLDVKYAGDGINYCVEASKEIKDPLIDLLNQCALATYHYINGFFN